MKSHDFHNDKINILLCAYSDYKDQLLSLQLVLSVQSTFLQLLLPSNLHYNGIVENDMSRIAIIIPLSSLGTDNCYPVVRIEIQFDNE